eukprot:gnl/TRDRNA2_/TRDRNA2_132735_c0_seq1.p1 gnl/TRDRNA2_/TRDRNA2_132735_c0~~gnl/TRDRNA2_/TRDRNA2_132735_c0_seq1.p1  ORF type:complete len:115 (-),score=31.66 gnl/TRDRNA2_/TRDRNA2_132735_c0_seq1:157-465(-)
MMDVNHDREINLHEFVEGCLRLQGQASSKNLMLVQSDIRKDVKQLRQETHRHMKQQDERLTHFFEQQDRRLDQLAAAVAELRLAQENAAKPSISLKVEQWSL